MKDSYLSAYAKIRVAKARELQKDSETNIYILKLKDNKYYIGKTDNLEKRKEAHMNGTASSWTKKYKPVSVEKIIPNASIYDEDRYVKEYMYKYGIDNVRGGTYVTEELDEVARYSLQKELWGANDCCTQCGRKGHFVKDCKYKKDVNGEDISFQWECDYCNNLFEDYNQCEKHEEICKYNNVKHQIIYTQKSTYINIKSSKGNNSCHRCGRTGHFINDCYARTDVDGDEIDSEDEESD